MAPNDYEWDPNNYEWDPNGYEWDPNGYELAPNDWLSQTDATDLQVDIQVDNIMFMAVSDVNTDHFQFGFPWEQFRHKQSTNSGSCEIHANSQVT